MFFIDTCFNMTMSLSFLSQDMRTVDPNFVKLFKLAQMTIEYLLVSEQSISNISDNIIMKYMIVAPRIS